MNCYSNHTTVKKLRSNNRSRNGQKKHVHINRVFRLASGPLSLSIRGIRRYSVAEGMSTSLQKPHVPVSPLSLMRLSLRGFGNNDTIPNGYTTAHKYIFPHCAYCVQGTRPIHPGFTNPKMIMETGASKCPSFVPTAEFSYSFVSYLCNLLSNEHPMKYTATNT